MSLSSAGLLTALHRQASALNTKVKAGFKIIFFFRFCSYSFTIMLIFVFVLGIHFQMPSRDTGGRRLCTSGCWYIQILNLQFTNKAKKLCSEQDARRKKSPTVSPAPHKPQSFDHEPAAFCQQTVPQDTLPIHSWLDEEAQPHRVFSPTRFHGLFLMKSFNSCVFQHGTKQQSHLR